MATKTKSIPSYARALLQLDPNSQHIALARLPVPRRKSQNEHLIHVHAVAPCKGELLWSKNFPAPNPWAKMLIPANDVAGTVVEAPEFSPFKVGDEVYARTNYARTGAARDYTIGLTEEMAHRPQRLTWVQSAAVPLSSETAWQALFVQAGLGDIDNGRAQGKRILVTAASGSVGAWIVQLARLADAEVIGTCGSGNVEFVKGLGATEVINYSTTDLCEWGSEPRNQVDIAIDCVGKGSLEGAWWAVKEGGMLISIFQPPEDVRPEALKEKKVNNLFFIMQTSGEQLEKITKLVEDGKCEPTVDSVWKFEEYEKAFEKLEGGHARGKVVLDLDASFP
ncbi:MAG: hypothetical protein Q9190_004215 [Brigantiaea leucoxantha]